MTLRERRAAGVLRAITATSRLANSWTPSAQMGIAPIMSSRGNHAGGMSVQSRPESPETGLNTRL
jgi:hypothetical protein